MRNKSIILALSISTLLLAGCSTTHYISVEPKAAVENTNLTNERVIKVSTSTKITNSIGSIKTGLNERADIYTTNDVKESVRESVMTGLRQLGFTPDQGVLPAADLQIHINLQSQLRLSESS